LQAKWLINKRWLLYMGPMKYCVGNARKKEAVRSSFLRITRKELCFTVQWTMDAWLHCSLNNFFFKSMQLIDFTRTEHEQ
jgi:hypothetical protein